MYSVDFGSQKLSILKNVYGFQSFRTGQEQVVDSLLAGKNTLAVMLTRFYRPVVLGICLVISCSNEVKLAESGI